MGRPVNPIPPGKVHHVPAASRGMESQQHDKAILGKPAKAKGYPLAVHDAMHHVQDGAFNAGISKTESAAALQGYELPTDPVVQHGNKQLPIPACHSATPSRADRSAYDPKSGRAILDQGIAETGGPDHPANMKRAVLPQAVDEQ